MRSAIAMAAGLVAAVVSLGLAQAQDFDLMQYADADHDGKVTSAEFTAFTAQGWDFIAMGAAKVKLSEVDPMFKGAFNGVKADADGYVDKDAYMAAAPGRFKAADKNGDGVLDAAELNASMAPSS